MRPWRTSGSCWPAQWSPSSPSAGTRTARWPSSRPVPPAWPPSATPAASPTSATTATTATSSRPATPRPWQGHERPGRRARPAPSSSAGGPAHAPANGTAPTPTWNGRSRPTGAPANASAPGGGLRLAPSGANDRGGVGSGGASGCGRDQRSGTRRRVARPRRAAGPELVAGPLGGGFPGRGRGGTARRRPRRRPPVAGATVAVACSASRRARPILEVDGSRRAFAGRRLVKRRGSFGTPWPLAQLIERYGGPTWCMPTSTPVPSPPPPRRSECGVPLVVTEHTEAPWRPAPARTV